MKEVDDFQDDKPKNHRAGANCLSALLICWTRDVFELGKKRHFVETDLPEPLDEHVSSKLGEKLAHLWSKEYYHASARKKMPSLSKVIRKCFIKEYLFYGIFLAIIELIIKPTQPIFLALLVKYFSVHNVNNENPDESITYFNRLFYYHYPQPKIEVNEALVYATCIITNSFLSVCVQHPYMLAVMHLGMKIRVACMSLMYRKALRISMLALSPITVGNIVNLMSNDVGRFDIIPMFLHYLWISPLQFSIFIYVMYMHVGNAAFIGSVVILIFMPIQMLLAYFNKKLRFKTALKTDERVRLMNEVITGMQVIKMYAWEPAFFQLIHKARKREMKFLIKTSYIRGAVMSMVLFTARIAIFVTLISFVKLFDNSITSDMVFLVYGYYMIMRSTMTVFFPQAVTQLAETLITIKRIRDFLLNEEAIVGNSQILHPVPRVEEPLIFIDDDNKKEEGESLESSVQIVAPQPIVPSIRLIEVNARWSRRYVLRDIDLTIKNEELVGIIGQVGAGKSSLLHVIIKELPVIEGYVSVKGTTSFASSDPWLFVGSVRQNILFGHEFNRERYRKVCRACALLKDFALLPYGDQTIIGERGTSLSGGQRARINLARCIYKPADIYILDDPLSAVDTQVGSQIFEQCITRFLKNKIRVLVTHQLQYLRQVDQLFILEKGRILARGTYSDLSNSGLDFAQYLEKEEGELKERKSVYKVEITSSSVMDVTADAEYSLDPLSEKKQSKNNFLESQGVGAVTCSLYKSYIQRGANCCNIITLIILFLITQGCASSSDYFIGQWVKIVEMETTNITGYGVISSFTSNECLLSYSIFTDLLVLICIIRSFAFFYICSRISLRLHDAMLQSILHGQMNFFKNNPSGRILNRFSKDMGAVDEDLPFAMIDFFQMFLNLIGVVIVLCIVNYFLLVPLIITSIAIYFVRRYYLKTSRSLKRVEANARSHVFDHLSASIQGLSTIRSHSAEQILTYEFDKHMDLHSSAWYLFISTTRAFSIWIDVMCVTFIALASFGFIIFDEVFGMKTMAGDVGLAITQCLTLTGLIPWGMRQSVEMENHMTAVERLEEFVHIDQEPDMRSKPDKKPHKTWPDAGEIIFRDTELRYSLMEEPVLKRMNIIISPEEKIGIVGRTGAGKSSLVSAIFRLAYQSGIIEIDGINIFEIGIHDLREKIAIIPQEPIIFTGSLRFNLDPYRQYTDETLLAALSAVELETKSAHVLKKPLTDGGLNFSTGQKQLLCLARAIVRNNKILILDEATANMDPRTDRLIQMTIRSKFAKCTVLTIAHRLHTIMDSDRIIVMHSGTCVEFDHPHILLQHQSGIFSSLVNQTGKTTADFLKKIAENNFLEKGFQQQGSHSSELEEEIY